MVQPIKIVIIDDHAMFLEGITSLLENSMDIEIVGTAKNGLEGFSLVKELKPNIVLTDIEMPEMDGIQFTKKIKSILPNIKVIALTSHSGGAMIQKSKQSNIDGYLLKKTGRMELLKAIYTVKNNEQYFSPEVIKTLKNHTQESNFYGEEVTLSPREKQILQQICKEKSSSQIAEELYISINTVETHRKNLMRKIGTKNMIGLAMYAVSKGIV